MKMGMGGVDERAAGHVERSRHAPRCKKMTRRTQPGQVSLNSSPLTITTII